MLKEQLVPAEITSRKNKETEASYYALVAWAQKAKLESRKINTQPVNLKVLSSLMPEIKKMADSSSEDFCQRIQSEQIILMHENNKV